ncbi:MAG: hypothetical protein L0Y44_00085 [Phycisphaerales bacterium]|nr:hypothetical protein [Phycisphaerales bacterium]MCI0629036.1 hypothetical protein [Phycisphaerales bacterium]MCI0674793.1 hypothetical protein [Phycisphaerales bacterium]
MTKPLPVVALEPVATALVSLGIRFYIGGSIASSLHGHGRSTLDVDLIADLHMAQVPALVARLEERYYIDEQMVRDAIRSRSSFNIIHLETSFKVDIFVMKRTPFEESTGRRAQPQRIPGSDDLELPVASAEDVILNKLDWFRQGGKASERQWRDVMGVLRVQQDKLDREYLRKWAAQLTVLDLLELALREAE